MREISDIQRDITKRRRRKMGLLMVRLAFFVGLPTIMGGYYFYNIATPMYATDSQFLIIQNEGTGGLGPLAGCCRRNLPTPPIVSRHKATFSQKTRCCGWTVMSAL